MAAVTVKKSFDENAENTVAIPREESDLKSYVSYNYPHWHVKEYATRRMQRRLFIMEKQTA